MTTPAVPGLAARILAAIDQTERIAQAAAKDSEPEWSPGNENLGDLVHTAERGEPVACGPYGYLGWELRQHIALNDPAKTLRRCAGDRETVNELLKIVGGDYIDDGELPLAEWMLGRLAATYDITEETT